MPTIDPTFSAIVQTGNTYAVVTICGMPNKDRAEKHAKAMLVEGQKLVGFESTAAAAQAKVDELSRSAKPGEGIDAGAPAHINEVLGQA